MGRPGVFKLYKKIGAAAFSLIPPRYDDRGYMSKHGAVLLEVAPGVGKQQWDWTQKITFAISVQDVANMLDSNPKKRRIYHESQDVPKTLQFVPGEGKWEGTYQLQLAAGAGDKRRQVMVPISNGEYTVLVRLLLSVCPLLMGWGEDALQSTHARN